MTDQADTFLLVIHGEVCDTTLRGMYTSTTELLLRDVFARYGLNDLRTSEEHVARALAHDIEVREGRRIHSTTGAGTEDSRDLRYDTGGKDVVLEDVTITTEGIDPLLDTSTTRVVEADHRRSHLHSELHDLADLGGKHLRECSTEHSEVLSEDIDQTTIDRTRARDDTVPEELGLVDTEVGRAV